MRWLRRSRLLIIALVSFLVVAGGALFKKSVALSLCGILSFNSPACNAHWSDSSRANAASPSGMNEIRQPTTDSSQEQKVARPCLFGVCAPVNLPKPIENVIQGGLNNAAKDKLRSLLADEIPISGSDHKFYPSVATLPGKPFTPQILYLSDLSPNTSIPAGDYEIPVHFYCTGIYSFNGSGNRFALAQLNGRMADALSALYARTSYDSSASINDIQTLAWAMQSGMAYNELSAPHKALVDRYIPEYRDSMQRSFVDRLTGISNQVSGISGGRVPDITKVLNTLGPVGDVAQSLLRAREQILRTNYSHQPLAQEFAPQKNFSLEGGVEKTPWSQVQENVYMRSIVPNGAMHDGTIQVRILNNGSRAADGSYQVAHATSLLATPASTETLTAKALLTDITKSVAVSEASHGQAAQATTLPSPKLAHPCNDNRILASYDKSNPQYHYFENNNLFEICSKKVKGCTPKKVFEIMISQARFIAPTTSEKPVVSCEERVLIPAAGFEDYMPELYLENRIKTVINENDFSITNYTLPGHIFYPGQIRRIVVDTDSAIKIKTTGEGIGGNKTIDVLFSKQGLWDLIDLQLKEKVRSVLSAESSSARLTPR